MCHWSATLSLFNMLPAKHAFTTMFRAFLHGHEARILPVSHSVQVAEQLCSAAEYLVRMGHAMWDLHEADMLVEGLCSPHLTILDIFMEPSPSLGLLTDDVG